LIRDSGGGYDASSPEAAIRTYVNALDSTDVETYNRIIHPNGQLPEISEGELSVLEAVDYTLESVQVVDETDTQATAEAEYTVEGPNGTQTQSSTVELRTVDGEWKIYSDTLS
jgi:hypothetical protein